MRRPQRHGAAARNVPSLPSVTRDHIATHVDGDVHAFPALAARPATPADAATIARIYNEGIEDRIATFETRLRTAADIEAWFDGVHPIVVVEDGAAAARRSLLGFAATSSYRPRE